MKLNHVIVSGRCGADIFIKQINDNFCVGSVNICTDESYKNKEGEWVNPANWITVKITNQNILKFADKIALKGAEICVHGAIKTETWEINGSNHSRTIVEVAAFKGDIQPVVRGKVNQTDTPPPPAPEENDLPF